MMCETNGLGLKTVIRKGRPAARDAERRHWSGKGELSENDSGLREV